MLCLFRVYFLVNLINLFCLFVCSSLWTSASVSKATGENNESYGILIGADIFYLFHKLINYTL